MEELVKELINLVESLAKANTPINKKCEINMLRFERKFVEPFVDALRNFLPNIGVLEKNMTYFLYDGKLEKGLGEITISSEKRKVYFYVLHKDGRKKVFFKSLNDEITAKEILKFVRIMINTIKTEEHHKDLTYLNKKENGKFNLKLFKENIERDLDIKIIHFKYSLDKNSYVFKYLGDITLKDLVDYLEDYLVQLIQLKVELPRVIEIKE